MGCGSSTPAVVVEEKNVEDVLNISMRVKKPTRKNLVWVREGVGVRDVYDVLEVVGQGSMGEVSVVQKRQDAVEKIAERMHGNEDLQAILQESSDKFGAKKPRQYACKTINTTRFSYDEILEFINEIEILRDLDHPNIVQLFEVLRIKRKMWIITELCTGGDLTSHLNIMTEMDVACVAEQITWAISYMHNRSVCHRDIKLENILYADSSHRTIKLIDFGLSDKFTKGKKMRKECGTIYTAAPEIILGQGYTERSDIWSIGVVTFIMLSGDFPFLRDLGDLLNDREMERFDKARLSFGYKWTERQISSVARDFVTACLQRDPAERWSAIDALDYVKHKWIPYLHILNESLTSGVPETILEDGDEVLTGADKVGSTTQDKKRVRMNSKMISGMGKFVLYGELKKTILMTMAHTMDKSSLHELREIFTVLDSTGSGTVSLVDLKKALKQMHSDKHIDDETIEKLFNGIDIDETGQIHYNEFLAAVVESQGLITMEHLADAFDRLDGDEKGYISKDDLKNLLGSDYNEEKVNRMMDEADYKKNGQVDYEEFLRLMFEEPDSGVDVLGKHIISDADLGMVDQSVTLQPSREILDVEESNH